MMYRYSTLEVFNLKEGNCSSHCYPSDEVLCMHDLTALLCRIREEALCRLVPERGFDFGGVSDSADATSFKSVPFIAERN